MKFASANCGTGRFEPFDKYGLFTDYRVVNGPDELTTDDCLCIWGGADISPSLYGKKLSKKTWADAEPSYRDKYEWALMQKAKELGIPIIGVCRGAQMLCALAGGFLIQHVDGHGIGHTVDTFDKNTLRVSSVHHQMMAPWEVDHKMVAWSSTPISNVYYDEDKEVSVPCEPEFVYFPKVKGFAIQWHPEFMAPDAPATKYVVNYMGENLG